MLVGEVAKRQAITNPDRTIRSVKRHMGTSWTVDVDGKSSRPQEISALTSLKEALEGSDVARIRDATEALNRAVQTLGQRLYEQSSAPSSTADDDEIVDAEIVDDERRSA